MNSRAVQKLLAVVVLLSFFLPLGYSLYHRIEPVVDARSYDEIAIHLLAGEGFRENAGESFFSDPSIIRAGPLYEFFLAGIYLVFGHRYEAVWIIQALLHALTALLVFLIARRAFPERGEAAGLTAAALIGLHPDLVEISAMLMTETLYLFLLTLTIFCFVTLYPGGRVSPWQHVLFGFAFAATVLIRPPVALFAPVILFWYALRKRYRLAALFVFAAALMISPWVARNYNVYGVFIPTTLIGEYNLWLGNTLSSDGGQFAGAENPATDYLLAHGAAQFKEKARTEFAGFVVEHPFRFAELTAVRFVRYFSLIRPMGFWFYQDGLPQLAFVALSGGSIALLFVTGFAGMWLAARQRVALWRYLVVLACTAPLPLLISAVQSRYRFQIYPLLAIFGGYFIVLLWRRAPGTLRVVLAIAGVLLAVSALDAIIFWPTIAERLGSFRGFS